MDINIVTNSCSLNLRLKILSLYIPLCLLMIAILHCSAENTTTIETVYKASSPLADTSKKLQIYELVAWEVVTPQWLSKDLYEISSSKRQEKGAEKALRFPYKEKLYGITDRNQELTLLSQEGNELEPSCSTTLELRKKIRRLINYNDFTYVRRFGLEAKHYYAETMGVRNRTFGKTAKILIPGLYLPIGWPLVILVIFFLWIFLVPTIGSVLVNVGYAVALIYHRVFWAPVKQLLRWVLIRREVNRQKWLRYLAPPHYLEPRSTWKMPYFLRHDYLEDIPPEVAYKPPINKIDYTMYILTPQDFNELDLEMDELEFIDELLQFKDEDPYAVARLLKHKLGMEKFYSYFDEDILSDEEEMDIAPPPKDEEGEDNEKTKQQEEDDKQKLQLDLDFEADSTPDYLRVLEMDEPWMHDEFDDTFDGTPYQLEEVRKRREIIRELRAEIKYLHDLISTQTMYEGNMSTYSVERKTRLQKKAKKLLERYLKYSQITKERIAEVEPSSKIQFAHNVALNKYLPLINQMSNIHHKLNLRHEKQKDPTRRAIQLDTFGGP